MIWMLVALLLLVSSVFLFLLARSSQSDTVLANLRAVAGVRAVKEASQPDAQAEEIGAAGRLRQSDRQEVAMLLAQAGWSSGLAAVRYRMVALFGPLAAGFGVWALCAAQMDFQRALQFGLMAAIAAFLLPRRVLRMSAAKRMQTMRREVPQFALLLRMLLDTGMTLEHALSIIVAQAERVIPTIVAELAPVVRRIQAGQDMAEALEVFRSTFQQGELYDIFVMLRQATEQGGNVRHSIDTYVEDMEKRLLGMLREYVGKLSGKMSLVMMLLLFPALLIAIAGPAMLAMVRGLAGMGS